jgi:hypothetical protein
MSIQATAKQIMSAMQSDAFNREACEQIIHQHDKEVLRMAQRRARLAFLHSNNNDFDTLKKIEQAIIYDDHDGDRGAAQPKPGSWLERSDQQPSLAKATDDKPQEWTHDDGYIYQGKTFIGRAFDEQDAKSICDAHNAALTAAHSDAWAKGVHDTIAESEKPHNTGDQPPRSMIERARANLWDAGGWTWQEIMSVIPEPAQPQRSENGWVIEKGDTHNPKYLSANHRRFYWTHDHLKAIRFARKQDAELVDSHFLLTERIEEHRICEHSWEPVRQCSEIVSAGSVEGKFHSQFDMSAQPSKASPVGEHLKECSIASTKPVEIESQATIHSIDDSLVSTPLGERSEWEQKLRKFGVPGIHYKSDQPPSSAKQEWRVIENSVGTWDIYSGDHKIADDISLKATAEWICAEFHAALAAERENEKPS